MYLMNCFMPGPPLASARFGPHTGGAVSLCRPVPLLLPSLFMSSLRMPALALTRPACPEAALGSPSLTAGLSPSPPVSEGAAGGRPSPPALDMSVVRSGRDRAELVWREGLERAAATRQD
ncbi:hypothetical protein FJT64_008604 [Amphibalanus amphitrite]|uniref:Uncharacterized protein n=2 Tax=Amphibalanus amphitrite TaxID=1232801 RepID=A0A6A4VGV0_AMPAM|nr:hypothetical protein FJT64_008604 [Amphibalanus amphitrite]